MCEAIVQASIPIPLIMEAGDTTILCRMGFIILTEASGMAVMNRRLFQVKHRVVQFRVVASAHQEYGLVANVSIT